MITIRNLTKTYFSKTGNVEALKPLNLDLPHSGFILLKGKSGSGKSTFLNLLGCLDEASSGSILFDGCDIASMNEKERNHFRSEKIGFCYQGDNLIPFLSVRENVFLETKNKAEEKLRTILENVDLKGFENRRCDELSGGQAQRVAIARAVYRDTVLLLCDEPTSALDGESAKSVFECLKREAVDRLVLVASHDEEAETYADAIFELKDGVLRSVKEYAFDDRAISRNEKKKTGHVFPSWRLLLHPFRKTPIRASLSVLLLSLCFGITLPLLSNVLLNSNALLLREVSSSPEMASFYLTREEKVEAKLDDEQARFLENKIAGPKYRVYCNGNGIENGAYGPSLGSCFAVYPEKDSIDNYLFSPTGAGYLAFEETDWSFPIVFGRAPRDEKECLIPYCYFPCYQKYGFRGADGMEHEGKELLDPNTFFSFRPTLLAPISDGRKELEIVGFVDTGFSLEQYPASLKPTDAKNACLSAELTNRLAKGPHCLTIVSKDFINHHFKSPSLISSSGVGKSLTLKEGGVEFPFSSFFDETNSKAERLLKMKDGDGVFLTKPAFARFVSSFNIEIPSEKQIDYSSCLKLGSAFETGVTDARLSRFSYLMEGNSTGIYEPNRLLLLASGDYVRQNGLPEGKEREHLVALAKQAYQDAFLRHEVDSIPDFANPSSETYLRSFYVKALFEREILLKEGEVDALFLDELLRDIDKSQIETISLNFQHPIYGKGDFTANVIGVHLDEDGAICLRGEPLEKAKSIFDDSEKATRILFKPGLNKEILRYGLSNPELEGLIVRVSHPKIAAFDYARDYMIPGIQQTASVIGGVLGVIALALLTLNATTWTREREEEFLLRRSLGMKKARAYGEILLTTGLVFGVSMLISIPLGFGFSAFLEGFIFDLFHCSLALFGLNGWAFLIVLGVSVMVNAIAVLPSVIALGKKKLTRSFH